MPPIVLDGTTGITTPDLTDTSLTSGRVVYAGTSGNLTGSSTFVFDGAILGVNGISVGRGAGAVATNTAVGASALAANTSGAFNVAVGRLALTANTTGQQNSALGNAALYVNTTGSYLVAIGQETLAANTTASYNTAVGYRTAASNTTGSALAAFGADALFSNTTGVANTAVGNSDGVSVGGALRSNTTGSNNTAVGQGALLSNTTASNSTAVGYQAGYTSTGQRNAFFGSEAGYANTTGESNTYIGRQAGNLMTSGNNNTIIGRYNGNQGGLDIRTASNHVVLSDGDGNVRAYWNNSGRPFFPDLGSDAGTNAVRFNTGTGRLSYDTSSARYKDNIRDSVYGLSHVMQMRSTQFEYKEGGRSDVGLIAEELQPIVPELVGINKEGQADSVSYDRMVSVLVKAIQELKAEFDAYKSTHP